MAKKKAQPAAKPQDTTKDNLVMVVLDRSGSMASCRDTTISGFNEYLKGLRTDKESNYDISLIQFDTASKGAELTVSYEDKPLADAPDLTKATYEPRGGTPLYDAIGECVRKVNAKNRGVIVVIITDGEENSSQEFTNETIKKLIKEKEAAGWSFVFLGADIDSYQVGSTLGVNYGSTANYTKGQEAVMYANTARATMTRAAANRFVGVRASSLMSFYDDNQKFAMDASYQPTAPQAPLVTTTVTGGRPAAPKAFRKKREWNTVSESK
jgi:VWA domain containing CoxE-like protein